jgi:O-antigen ligase
MPEGLSKNTTFGVKSLLVIFFAALTLFLREFIVLEYSTFLGHDDTSLTSTLYLGLIFLSSFLIVLLLRRKGYYYKLKLRSRFIIFCCIIIFFSFFHAPFVKVGSRNIYLGLLCYITCFEAFYYLSYYKTLDRHLKHLLFITFFILVFSYFSTYVRLGLISSKLLPWSNRFPSLKSSYILLFLFPLMSFFSERKFQVIIAIITITVIIYSNKRGGAIVGAGGFIIYFYLAYWKYDNINNKSPFRRIFLFCLLFAILYFVIVQLLKSSDNIMLDRLSSMQDDEGSGRLEIWAEVIEKLKHVSLFGFIFGHGLDSVKSITSNHSSAHNEYLELFYDLGIVAFISFLSLIISMVRSAIYYIKNKKLISPSFSTLIFIFIAMSFVSHTVIYPTMMIVFSLSIGYFIGFANRPASNIY